MALLHISETLQDLLDALFRCFRIFRQLTNGEAEVEQLGRILGVESYHITRCCWKEVCAILQLEFHDRFHSSFERTSTPGTALTRRRGFSVDGCSEKAGFLEFIRLQPFQDSCHTEWFVQGDLGEPSVTRDGDKVELGKCFFNRRLGDDLEVSHESEVLKQELKSGIREKEVSLAKHDGQIKDTITRRSSSPSVLPARRNSEAHGMNP